MRYLAVIERGEHNYSAYIPDLPGCVATGRTVREVTRNIAEAAQFHVEGLLEADEEVPEPTSTLTEVSVGGDDEGDSRGGAGDPEPLLTG